MVRAVRVAAVAVLLLLAAAPLCTALNNGLGRTPPLGWNTWCTDGRCGRDLCTEHEVKSVATSMVENGMLALGYNYINLDDCWADYRDAGGNIHEDRLRFPSGMKALADFLHSNGFHFGLYTDSGLYTCSSGGRFHKIPGSYGHYEQDAATYASWGMDFVKMDWCNTKVNGTQLDPRVQYPEMSASLNATGRPIFFSMCEWGVDQPWTWAMPVGNSWRTGPDHHDNWQSTADIIERNADLQGYSGPGGWNDLDFLMTGGQACRLDPLKHCAGQSDDEYRTEFSLWVMLASPLVVATDVRHLSDIMKECLFNKELLAVNQDPLGVQARRIGFDASCAATNSCQIWTRPLADGTQAVALYNAGDTVAAGISVTAAQLGWAGASVRARDLWKHQDVGTFTDRLTASSVPSHGTAVFLVERNGAARAGVPRTLVAEQQ